MKASTQLIVRNKVGLHARPAALFVQMATRFKADITVENLSAPRPPVNAKSILSVLTCGVQQGQEIRIQADGDDAQQAIDALTALVENDLEE